VPVLQKKKKKKEKKQNIIIIPETNLISVLEFDVFLLLPNIVYEIYPVFEHGYSPFPLL
jgi:cellobiose-specific phosphotransferase system component IIB